MTSIWTKKLLCLHIKLHIFQCSYVIPSILLFTHNAVAQTLLQNDVISLEDEVYLFRLNLLSVRQDVSSLTVVKLSVKLPVVWSPQPMKYTTVIGWSVLCSQRRHGLQCFVDID